MGITLVVGIAGVVSVVKQTPMYLSINVEAVESTDEDEKINVNALAAGDNEQTQE